MTQDYKDILLKYLTGNIEAETGNNTPIFDEQLEALDKNIEENITTKLTNEQSASSIRILGKIFNQFYSTYLIYGYYTDTSSTNYGFIYLVDTDLNEIQMITTFASGTKLFPLVALNQAEDGNIYGLSSTITSPSTIRVMLFNNIFTSGLVDGEYKAVLRNDYIVPYSYSFTYFLQNSIIKSPESATYYILLRNSSDDTSHIIKFVINVGATNDWIDNNIGNYRFFCRYDVKLDKSSGNEIYLLYGVSPDGDKYYEIQLDGNSVSINKSISLEGTISPTTYSQVFVKDENNIYVFASYTGLKKGVLYKVNGNNLDTLYTLNYYYVGTNISISYLILFEINNGIFIYQRYKEDATYYLSIGYLDANNNITWYNVGTTNIGLMTSPNYIFVDFYYKSMYNLVDLYFPIYSDTNTTTKLTFDYNAINYNGESYENNTSLIPTKGRLYDSNNKMIFARNIYNKTVYGNTTLSQIQIPNTILNDITIAQENLIGQTNIVLNENVEDIEKNIYETLFINFYNTLLIQDQNTPDYINNIPASETLNFSVSNAPLDYSNRKATKYRVNFLYETSETYEIQPTIENKIATYNMTILLPNTKIPKSIEIISQDEATVYQTINISSLATGKIYNVVQECHIE